MTEEDQSRLLVLNGHDINMILNAYHQIGQTWIDGFIPLIRHHSDDDLQMEEAFQEARLLAFFTITVLYNGVHPMALDWGGVVREGGLEAVEFLADIYDQWQEHEMGLHDEGEEE